MFHPQKILKITSPENAFQLFPKISFKVTMCILPDDRQRYSVRYSVKIDIAEIFTEIFCENFKSLGQSARRP
jgi:hypothetical protein